ncbi:cytochrome P450 4c3 isoform X2 [Venturia canescens]|uniref:cytochrome P450 4c3 isoform X2 n=1 Tax=Venturia canescens TaxID=32260 RepID=UPI001C9BCE55|nr:cytochrome P450 4c3 isoform X2 [Venturia canescens]
MIDLAVEKKWGESRLLDATNFLAFLLLSYVLWTILRWWHTKKKYWKYFDDIPGPLGLPLIGNIVELNVDHDELYQRLFGLIMLWGYREGINKAWGGWTPYVFLSKAETVEAVLNNSRHIDKSSDYKFLHPWLGTGLLTSSGKKWYHRRKILTPSFHFSILDDFLDVFCEQTETLIERLSSEVDQGAFNIFPYVTLCTLDIICETAMGRPIHAQKHSDSEYVRAVYEIGNIIHTRQAIFLYRPDCLFRLTSLYKRHQECVKVLHNFSYKVIAERRVEIEREKTNLHADGQLVDEATGTKNRLAFLDLLIEASKNGTVLSNDDIREEVDTFMFEGHDTTSSAVSWTLYLLGCHPEYQEKIVEELDEIFEGDRERRPTMRDLKNMKYLEKCIKEALRLYPSVPFIARRISERVKIGKHVVPEGTTAIITVPILHRDAKVYRNPDKFDPERFSPENSTGRHPYAYIPFSAGPRNCIV